MAGTCHSRGIAVVREKWRHAATYCWNKIWVARPKIGETSMMSGDAPKSNDTKAVTPSVPAIKDRDAPKSNDTKAVTPRVAILTSK
jgi:hypothetical protein